MLQSEVQPIVTATGVYALLSSHKSAKISDEKNHKVTGWTIQRLNSCGILYFIPCIKASFMKKPTNTLINFIRCLLTTPTCFGRLLRPSSGCTVLNSNTKSSVWRINPRSEFTILLFIIIINCKWVCTRWQWYYNTIQYNTQQTQKTKKHKITHTHSKQYTTQ